ncbi:MAG: DMT family transporter [Myxococcota bacterium]
MGELAALVAALLWAIASTQFAVLGQRLSALTLNVLKTLIGLLFMAVTLVITSGNLWPPSLDDTDFAWLVVSGLLGLTIGDWAYFQSLIRLGARRALLLWALIPPLTALGAVPVLGEPLGPRLILGITVTVGGVTWVMREQTDKANQSSDKAVDLASIGFGILAVLAQCGGSLTAKLGGHGLDALSISVVRLAAGSVGILVWAIAQKRVPAVLAVLKQTRLTARVVTATFVGTYLGIWLSMLSLQLTLAGIAATLSSTSPIFVLPIARFWLRESVSFRAIVGATIAVAGIAILVAPL